MLDADILKATAWQAMALDGTLVGACALAGVAIDLLSNPALLEQARNDFEHVR